MEQRVDFCKIFIKLHSANQWTMALFKFNWCGTFPKTTLRKVQYDFIKTIDISNFFMRPCNASWFHSVSGFVSFYIETWISKLDWTYYVFLTVGNNYSLRNIFLSCLCPNGLWLRLFYILDSLIFILISGNWAEGTQKRSSMHFTILKLYRLSKSSPFVPHK